jgi:hypothetical protein
MASRAIAACCCGLFFSMPAVSARSIWPNISWISGSASICSVWFLLLALGVAVPDQVV